MSAVSTLQGVCEPDCVNPNSVNPDRPIDERAIIASPERDFAHFSGAGIEFIL